MSAMEAAVTAEQRPAYLSISGIHNKLVGATHIYQGAHRGILCESPCRIRPPLFRIFYRSAFGVLGPVL